MKNNFKVFIILILLTGVLYPLFLTGIAKFIFPQSYEGNLIFKDEVCRGSFSLSQKGLSEKYLMPSEKSCSSVDPYISPQEALLQAPALAKARGDSIEKIERLISHFTQKKSLGFLGPVTINSMQVNFALDENVYD